MDRRGLIVGGAALAACAGSPAHAALLGKRRLLLAGSVAGGNSAQSSVWVMGYYAAYHTSQYPINRIDFTGLTHIIIVHWLTNADGTITGGSSAEANAPSIITAAHAAGVKVVMMLGGSDDVNYPSAANSTHRATLISSILSKISTFGMDGVDLDWENGIVNADFIALASGLRSAAPLGTIITIPLDPTVGTSSLAASLAPYADRINMFTYGGAATGVGWQSWYFSALGGDDTTHPSSLIKWVNSYLSAGVPRSKLGFGIGFYNTAWTTPVTDALQTISGATATPEGYPYGWTTGEGGGVISTFYNQSGATYLWSGIDANSEKAAAKQPSLSIPGGIAGYTWITYEDEPSIAAKAAYSNANGLAGIIIWTIDYGCTDPVIGRNPLLDSVKLGFLKKGPAPCPRIADSGSTSVPGATTITVTGLPSNLGQVIATWWNGSANVFDLNFQPGDAGYGRPSEYYIEGSVSGASWVQLSHVTGNFYAGQQFAYDFTSTGYTQVRIRVISLYSGAPAGTDLLRVNRADNNATDTWILLGDSITSNSWNVYGYPQEQFGTQVNALRPARYPAVMPMGFPFNLATSTAAAGGPLNTSVYGVPAIRKWLTDFPSVKYVGLSYGTNDANGNVAAATYQAALESLVQEIIAAGKTPVIPTLVSSPAANIQTNGPSYLTAIANVLAAYPAVIPGPDLWTLFFGHSVADGWFQDSLHPSATIGTAAFQNAWATTMVAAIYPP